MKRFDAMNDDIDGLKVLIQDISKAGGTGTSTDHINNTNKKLDSVEHYVHDNSLHDSSPTKSHDQSIASVEEFMQDIPQNQPPQPLLNCNVLTNQL